MSALRVRLIDDDEDLRAVLAQTLTLAGIAVEDFPDASRALHGLDADFPGIVLSDLRMPGMDGLQLFAHLSRMDADLPVILLTGHGDVRMAVEALQAGAYDFLTKPVGADRLTASVRRALAARALVLENRRLHRRSGEGIALAHPPLMGDSAAMIHLRDTLERVAEAQTDALILGPSGSGKSLVARAIHRQGPRRARALAVLDCATTTEAAFDALMSGGEGPRGRVPGLLETAHRGILCLENAPALPRHLQARLLGLVEAGQHWPAGAAAPRALDLQLLATAEAEPDPGGAMHPGLYYRLSRAQLRVPALSARGPDVPALFRHFLRAAADRLARRVPPLTDLVMARLAAHSWPGNLRELEALAESHVLGLTPWDTPEPERAGPGASGPGLPRPDLQTLVASYEAALIRDALRATSGNATEAMALLGVARKTFYDKLTRHGIRPADFRP